MVCCVADKEAEKMRNTLEDLYYGNITPGKQQITPNSELKRAVDRIARFESQLTERLDEDGQAILANSLSRRMRPKASQRWKTSFWVSGWAQESRWNAWMKTTAISKQEVNDHG